MDVKTLLAMMAGILVIGIAIAVGYVQFATGGGSQSDGPSMSEAELRDVCGDVRDVTCRNGSISDVEYPPNCFVDGEHVLADPYSCPGS
jgi:hypothetical protein